MSHSLRIMGIDPGLRHMGWGVVALDGTRLSFVACGSINPPAGDALAARLAHLHRALTDLVAEHRPDEVAVEETFVNKDARATLKLGQARGIALVVPALAGLSVAEYAPNAVKKAVVGVGHAEKAQIGLMVKTLLPKATIPSADAADALALAICHAHHRPASLAAALRRASA